MLSAPAFSNYVELTLAGPADWPPFSYLDAQGEPSGTIIDYWRIWGEKNHARITFKLTEGNESIRMVLDREADAHAGMTYTRKWASSLSFTPAFLDIMTGIFVKKSLGVWKIEDIPDGALGVASDQNLDGILEKNRPDLVYAIYPTEAGLLRAVAQGEIRAVAMRHQGDFRDFQAVHPQLRDFVLLANLKDDQLRAATRKDDAATLNLLVRGMNKVTPEDLGNIGSRGGHFTLYPPGGLSLSLLVFCLILLALLAGGAAFAFRRNSRARERLRENALQLQALVDNAPLGIFQALPDSTVLSINPEGARIHGFDSSEEFISHVRKFQDMLAPPSQLDEIRRMVELRGRASGFEIKITKKDGSSAWVSLEIQGIFNPLGEMVRVEGFVTDASARKRNREILQEAKNQAERADRAKGHFLATMSHEIRTPLNAIIGMAELALKSNPSGECTENLRTIGKAADHLLQIINEILEYSRIEAGKVELMPQDVFVRDIMGQVLDTFRPQARRKGLDMSLDIAPDVPECIKGDPLRIRQILINLLSNAIKFTDKGRVDMAVSTSPPPRDGFAEGRTYLAFTVIDTGMGIPEDQRTRIFDSFTQADNTLTRKYEGTGLGLSITLRLARLMNGSISLDSTPGKGSRFTFTAPFEPGDAEAAQSARDLERPSEQTLIPPLKILVVEDNDVNALLASKLLSRMGHTPAVATDGESALRILEGERFDLVLMDLEMPLMDGFEAVRRMRQGSAGEAARTLPVVAMTAHAMEETREACLGAGMNEYICKPVTPASLHAVLARAVGMIEDLPPPTLDGSLKPASASDSQLVDDEAGIRRTGGNRELLNTLRSMYLEEIPQRLGHFETALANDDRDALRRQAHALKGTSVAIGALQCAELAERLEHSALDPKVDPQPLFAALDKCLERTAEILKKGLAGNAH